jgi:VIT1/CCC1 family predicted Fe2+/Mn2+ transporter
MADAGVLNRTDTRSRLQHAVVSRGGGGDSLLPMLSTAGRTRTHNGAIAMLYTIAVILLIAWVLGLVGTYTIGSFVHVLLVVAIVLFLVGLLSGRRTLFG